MAFIFPLPLNRAVGVSAQNETLLRSARHRRSPQVAKGGTRAVLHSTTQPAVSATVAPVTQQPLNWDVTLPSDLRHEVLNVSPPLLRLPGFLTTDECGALISAQLQASPSERDNYLNFDSGAGHGLRQGVDPTGAALVPVLRQLSKMFPGRAARFAEELFHRPSAGELIVRDATTVHYQAGEGVARHVDGKDLTLLVYLQAPTDGGATVFPDIGHHARPAVGDALLYESKEGLLHFAEDVADGEKWVLQLLVDYRVRADDF